MKCFRGPIPYLIAGLLIHVVFLAALGTDLLRPLFNDTSHTRRGFDFGVFYLAGQALAEGRDIYSVSGAFGFRYLPAFALVASLFAQFQPLTAYFLHLCCTELFLAVNLYLTWRWVEKPRRGLALFMWLAFSPHFLELYMGQVSFWAASLFFWLIVGLHSGRERVAGLCWAGALLVKPNALILAPALLRLRAWRVLFLGLLAGLLTSLPYFLLHPDSWGTFFAANIYGAPVQGALTHAGNLGLQGGLVSLVAQLAGRPLAELTTLADLPLAGRAVIYCSQAAILVATLVATYRGRDALPLLALWMCTFFLVYKDVWEHHYVFLQPVIVALYAHSGSPKFLWIFALIAQPTPFVLFDIEPGVYGPIDPERTWGPVTSLAYRSTKLIPLGYLWYGLCRTCLASAPTKS
ncbi:MAG: DUF2029 domain-containing protein [Gemmatimonadetes bacterium]|nr:DUF2029 domain-containing protein [Gemmatimonadota bacterium]